VLILKRGDTGVDVITVQRRLQELGDYTGKLDGIFGPMMGSAVRQFQARAGLEVDGKVGPITLASLFPQAKETTEKTVALDGLPVFHFRMLSAARSQVGVVEVGWNRGPEVEAYLKSVGLDPGNPYCLAGIYWCAKRSADMGGVENPMLRTGHCETFLTWAREHGYCVKAEAARPSDIGIMLFGGGKGHAVMLSKPKTVGSWLTVEFNTNTAGGREGEGVRGDRVRRYTELAGIVRLPEPRSDRA